MIQEVTLERGDGRQLFFEGLRTPPHFQYGGQMLFALEKVAPLPSTINENTNPILIRHYIKDCAEAGIIPFSKIQINFWSSSRSTPFHLSRGVLAEAPHYRHTNEVIDGILKGGRIHEVAVDFRTNERSYQNLAESFLDLGLPVLTASGHLLQNATMHLLHSGNATDSAYKSHQTHLNFIVDGNQSTLQLSVGEDTGTDWRTKELTDWFTNLTQASPRELRLFVNA